MEYAVKYGTWNISQFDTGKVQALCQAGYSPLAARVLCSRGFGEPAQAREFLSPSAPMPDPFAMQDMQKAADRLRLALQRGETIAVYGDYDVDGITATCLLTEFLRSQGGKVEYYIPGRIEEGYGLNIHAVADLKARGVSLIVTVDCGITACQEAEFCQSQGVDLIITDHHECKDELPHAIAVVDPHRKDDTYPHRNLAGVGVAFKLAAAIVGSQEVILERFSDLLCLGTVADVMPLVGENRAFVAKGLHTMTHAPRPGIVALMEECGCEGTEVTASAIGYTLAPRINAAGRMGQVELATELFLTSSMARAKELAKALCQLNRQRQEVEAEIYRQAQAMLREEKAPAAIVLAGENWHQGVVGIVASRLAEEYGCPAYLVCWDGDHGKASSRSYGGFNLFASLEQLSHLLESYGGHELAAGFTIGRDQIENFREEVCALAEQFAASGRQRAALEIDCAVEPELLTQEYVMELDQLEPCGAGCPKPVLYMDGLTVDQLSEVGGGKHLRLRLSRDGMSLGAIFFSATAARCGISQGDVVEAAFTPQINDFRGVRSVQLNLVDLRPQQNGDWHAYERHSVGENLSPDEAAALLPQRSDFAALWRYLTVNLADGQICVHRATLAETLAGLTGAPWTSARVQLCLDVLRERGLLTFSGVCDTLQIFVTQASGKVDLEQSPIMIKLKQQKGAP